MLFLTALLAVTLLASEARAQPDHLRIGAKIGPSAIDPHYHSSGENNTLLRHIYDSLVVLDNRLRVRPSLATTWRNVAPLVWEFELRRDVRFHDGTPFSATDVVFTFERIPKVRNSPGSFEIFTRRIARIEVVDNYRLRFHTKRPHPFLDHDLSAVMIVPHTLDAHVDTPDFNRGTAAIGTGPYRYAGWTPGRLFSLVRNEGYWGQRPVWRSVNLVPISSDPTRVAALLNNEVDLIDHVPLADRGRLNSDPEIAVFAHEAARLMFVHLDSARARSPYVTDHQGKVLDPNPLRDARVRRALSAAIDRAALVDHLLDGAGSPAAQILPPDFEGSSDTLRPEDHAPERARRLLAEAGYPEGFRLTLHSPSDRYPNDARVAQAIAQMWWRIGVVTEVETLTRNVFFPSAARQEFSAYFAGWAELTVANAMAGLVHSYDRDAGLGSGNRARYANSEVDRLVEEALTLFDPIRRQTLLSRAQEIAFREDQGLIPLYHPDYAWAARAGHVLYDANMEGATQAVRARRLEAAAR